MGASDCVLVCVRECMYTYKLNYLFDLKIKNSITKKKHTNMSDQEVRGHQEDNAQETEHDAHHVPQHTVLGGGCGRMCVRVCVCVRRIVDESEGNCGWCV